MSLKNVIRARFRNSDKSEKMGSGEDKEEEATTCSTPTNVSCRKITRPGKMNIPEEDTFESGSVERETENSSISGQGSVQGSPESPRSECIHPLSPEDRISFEQHLTQLQEQLVAIMMENQALTTELNEYKSVCQLEKVKQELDYEKSRNQLLEEKCQTLEKRRRKVQRSKSDATHHTCPEETDCHDMKERSLLKEDDREALNDFIEVKVVGPKTRWQRVWDSIVCQIYEIINDFSEVPESVPEVDTDGDPLTVRKLKNNITRFGAVTQPYMNTIQGLKNLVQWKSPSYTLFVFTVYMYSTWNGLLLPVTLFLILFRLAINYMRYKGWNLNLHYLDPGEEVKESEDKDKGVSDKFNVVLQVAKKVQNTLGALADTLEKINSLLTWRYPPATKQLFSAICLAFIVSCLFEASMIFYVIGILIGIKLFIIDYMFEHFPRFKQKYDSSHRLWENLPTEAEFRKKTMRVQIDKTLEFLSPVLSPVVEIETIKDVLSIFLSPIPEKVDDLEENQNNSPQELDHDSKLHSQEVSLTNSKPVDLLHPSLSSGLHMLEHSLAGVKNLDFDPLHVSSGLHKLENSLNSVKNLDFDPLHVSSGLHKLENSLNSVKNLDFDPLHVSSGLHKLENSLNSVKNFDFTPIHVSSGLHKLENSLNSVKPVDLSQPSLNSELHMLDDSMAGVKNADHRKSSAMHILENQLMHMKHILPLNQFEDKEEIDQTMDFMTDNDKSFCELFNLPHSENPLQGWHGGRRCALINKDKSLTAAFKNGKLYLTRSFLCFERTKFPSSKNLVLPLSDIIKLERAKPYPWLPGGGMAIEVTMADSEKPYIFGALLNREECYQSIQSAGSAGGWNWGEQSSSASSTSSSSSNLASTSSQSKSSPHKRLHRSHTLRFDETVTYAYTDTDVDDC